MKILEKATTPNGIKIQLEDWSHSKVYELGIGAYPIVKNSSYVWFKSGEKFRVYIGTHSNYSNDDVKSDFEALKNGGKTLEDLLHHSLREEDIKYLLGIIDRATWERNYKLGKTFQYQTAPASQDFKEET